MSFARIAALATATLLATPDPTAAQPAPVADHDEDDDQELGDGEDEKRQNKGKDNDKGKDEGKDKDKGKGKGKGKGKDKNESNGKNKDKNEDKNESNGTPDELRFGGRVYVRDTLSAIELAGDTLWLEDRTIDSARAFLSFRPNRRTRMDVEVDFAGDEAELKDTFIGYEPGAFLDVTVGRFKRPVSFIGLESSWRLPRIDRGLLSELRIHERRPLFAGGRGDGVALRFQTGGSMDPELTLAVQESDLAEDFGLEVSEVNQDLFARLELEPVPTLHLAMAGGWVGSLGRFEDPTTYRHRLFGTLEGFLERETVRVWLEGMAGRNANTYVGGQQLGWFAAARTLIAPRFTGAGSLKAFEPYVGLGWLEPSTRQAGDQLAEATIGGALWISGKLRLQLEGTRRLAQDLAAVSDATIVRIQLGAAFEAETILE